MGTIVVSVKPGSRRPGVSVAGEAVEVRVAAPARDGLATEAVRTALAEALGRPHGSVKLVRGGAARHKTFAVDDMTWDEALARLAAAAGA